jgi:putative transposase
MPDWPHAPVHRLTEAGAFIVTAGTYLKRRILDDGPRRQLVHDALLAVAAEFGWELQAWAVLSNHYHFVALSPADAATLRPMISKFHTQTAAALNAMDGTPGRQVWYQYWETHLTFQRAYLARLRYVHENPVRHGAAKAAEEYPWCSTAWFERTAPSSFRRTVRSFKTDRLDVIDDF